jgi:endo-1,4-beta-xylanase
MLTVAFCYDYVVKKLLPGLLQKIMNATHRCDGVNFLALTITIFIAIFAFSLILDINLANAPGQKLKTRQISSDNLITNGQWAYLPGATFNKNGLQISYRGFAIVEQNGLGGQPNPPVNEYGTYLNLTPGNDFTTNAILENITGTVALELYGKTPPISDEFRVEVPSLRLTLEGSLLSVQLWDGQATADLANQQPIAQMSFSITHKLLNKNIQLGVIDQLGQLTFSVNGYPAGQLADHNIFANHQVWFGANAIAPGASFTLASLTARGLDSTKITAIDSSAFPAVAKNPSGLQQLASKKRPGFLIGSDAALWAVTGNQQYNTVLFGGNFGIITPENAMKWQFTEPQPGLYDFHEADALVNDALKNGLEVHGHALVFSEALPSWVQNLPTVTPADKANVKQIMVDHITALVSHFSGRVGEWDVVNEPIADYGTFNGNSIIYRDNVFYRAMGQDYIAIALEAAHAADPKAKLYINDFGNENDDTQRWQATFRMLKTLITDHVPIYGFGFESHIYDPITDDIINSNGNGTILEDHINQLAAIGIQSSISEMDSPMSAQGYTSDASSQAQQFAGVLKICLNNPHCLRFSIWSMGITDLSQDDISHTLDSIEVDSPFNQSMQPTATFTALQNVLQ